MDRTKPGQYWPLHRLLIAGLAAQSRSYDFLAGYPGFDHSGVDHIAQRRLFLPMAPAVGGSGARGRAVMLKQANG